MSCEILCDTLQLTVASTWQPRTSQAPNAMVVALEAALEGKRWRSSCQMDSVKPPASPTNFESEQDPRR